MNENLSLGHSIFIICEMGCVMTGFLIAIISGALMSIQGVFNSCVAKNSSIWVASGFVQLTALAVCVAMWFGSGRPEVAGILRTQPRIALLGGVIGAFITYTVVRAINDMGPAKASLAIVVSQVLVAYAIQLFGLFGSEKAEFAWMKLFGLALAIVGLAVFNLCGTA
jgi:transporter family-2 protein